MRSLFATLILVVLSTVARVDAAPVGAGRHFIVAFPDTLRHFPPPLNPIAASASFVIFAQQRTTVTVNGPGIRATVVVDSSRSTTVSLPTSSPVFLDLPDVKQRRTFDIVADGDIVV
ncbi:MAG: hypothetical protein H7X80_04200, partial [bacterium]|nr:hypothetical protein [Candidatus Kapabacteria bacterium]